MPDSNNAPAEVFPAQPPDGKDLTALITHLAREFSGHTASALPSSMPFSGLSGAPAPAPVVESQAALVTPPVHPTFDPLQNSQAKSSSRISPPSIPAARKITPSTSLTVTFMPTTWPTPVGKPCPKMPTKVRSTIF